MCWPIRTPCWQQYAGQQAQTPDKPGPSRYISGSATSRDSGPAPIGYGKFGKVGNGGQDSDDLAMRRRRLKFRCWHRGMKETDLLLGRFADAHVDGLDAAGVAAFEALLETPDQVILAWIVGDEAVPTEARTPLLDRLLAFYAA